MSFKKFGGNHAILAKNCYERNGKALRSRRQESEAIQEDITFLKSMQTDRIASCVGWDTRYE